MAGGSMPVNANGKRRVELLLKRLGYTRQAGWIDASAFAETPTHRFAMLQAKHEMSVIGAFCLKSPNGAAGASVTPLVYVALARDGDSAEEVHRKIWSQGLAPFSIIVMPERVAVCSGFSYSHRNWKSGVYWFTWDEIETLPSDTARAVDIVYAAAELWDLRAIRLKTSLFWREHEVNVDGRVDRRLLANLNNLSGMLICGKGVSRRISPTAANGLIGRFLYVFFLADRGIIDQDWVNERGHEAIRLEEQEVDWPGTDTWSFLDDLDSIFNGSIFPLTDKDRTEIDESHINLVRRVMKHGAQPTVEGGVQLSFLDIYYGALRTETLSVVYEQFLENLHPDERRRVGAFYTPPYLVDFMLDRIEEVRPFEDGTTVLDPAAGSGVFLVAVYRRLIEKWLLENRGDSESVDVLRGLLIRNIFGVERNADACHVAAFSLYLTMLDYADPRDLSRITAGEEPEKIFPELVGANLSDTDFFSDELKHRDLPERVECVVGNPPWQKLDILESEAAEKWRSRQGRDVPIGRHQIAELFAWKAIREHLQPDGVLGLLLPAKTFVNPTAWKFRRALGEKFTVLGVANFSHFRHRLFARALQAAAAVFVRKAVPSTRTRTWVCSPMSIGQPIARQGYPWTFIFDRADVRYFRQERLSQVQRGWFEALMLRPVDRQIREFLEDAAALGKVSLLGSLCKSMGADIRRGGNPEETGVSRRYLVAAVDAREDTLDFFGSGNGYMSGVRLQLEGMTLPPSQRVKVLEPYRHQFLGNVLLVPRSFKEIAYVEPPLAFTSNIMSVFFAKDAGEVTARERQFLKAVGAYLRSPMGQYLVATTGRRWLMDRRNIEPRDLAEFPIPFVGLEDSRIDEVVSDEGQELECEFWRMLGLSRALEAAIKEFLAFRVGFQDGGVPEAALTSPNRKMIGRYERSLRANLDQLIGRRRAFSVASRVDKARGVAAVVARFDGKSDVWEPDEAGRLCDTALQRYQASEANAFSDSLHVALDDERNTVAFVKPLEYFRWTIDGAFADSRQMINVFATDTR